MKKSNVIILIIASVITAALTATAGLFICQKLFNKNYFTVSE